MDYKAVLSDRFISDLEEIVAYLKAKSGDEIAARIGNELVDRAESLARNPHIGQLVRGRPGVRKILRYSYKLFYQINDELNVVEILRVWHGRRNPSSLRLK